MKQRIWFLLPYLAISLSTSLANADATATIAKPDPSASIRIGELTVTITKGATEPICKMVLATIQSLGHSALGQCVPKGAWNGRLSTTPDPRQPYPYLRWSLIRNQLPSAISLPHWEVRDLANQAWHAEAVFAYAITNLRHRETLLSLELQDYEIKGIVAQYLMDGTLPYNDGRDHSPELTLPHGATFSQATIGFPVMLQLVNRFIANSDPIYNCDQADEAPEGHAYIQFTEPTGSNYGLATVPRSDVLETDNEVYFVANSNRFMSFEKYVPNANGTQYTSGDLQTSCTIEILPEGNE